MDSTVTGEFRIQKIDGKKYFVFHLNHSDEAPMDSGDTDNNYLSESTMFLCPTTRINSVLKRYKDLYGEKRWEDTKIVEMDYCKKERLDFDNHHYVLPLFWCKNIDDVHDYHDYRDIYPCQGDYNDGTDYYFCKKCDRIYHKECVESPPEIRHPCHPNHPLKLFYFKEEDDCVRCEKTRFYSIYHCIQCNLSIDPVCAQRPIPLVIDEPKRHNHPLTFFTRKAYLDCNVCGLVRQMCSTYVCLKCNFVAHQDCYDSPTVIRISRHKHHISFTSSLPPGEWSCGVCRKNVDSEYGAYTCKNCDGYVVHLRCALRKDIWDGKELEGVVEEDDIDKVVDPFERISDGIILHFCHDHYLKLETSGEVYDENKICNACVVPIYEGDFYSCIECNFILHDKCANAPRKIRHPLHPHPLTLKVNSEHYKDGYYVCDACHRQSSGFVYEYYPGYTEEGLFQLDVHCASISEPFDYQGHEHLLFLALDPRQRRSCQECDFGNRPLLNCIKCDYIRCLECITIPYMVRYKHDKHFVTLVHGDETDESDWCEICEKSIFSEEKVRRFYRCNECCTTLHIDCLRGKDPYMKPGHTILLEDMDEEVEIIANNSLTRPICDRCEELCKYKTFYEMYNDVDRYTYCSWNHVTNYM